MRPAILAVTAFAALAACNDVPWSRSPETAAVAAETQGFPPGASLRDGLDLIGAVLDSAIATQLDDAGVGHIMRVEALTDRVLETEIPFGWLTEPDYSIESKVWQIQARADRIVARLRANARRDELLTEVQGLRADVSALRGAISGGGAPAPVSVDLLLQRLDSATRRPVPPGT